MKTTTLTRLFTTAAVLGAIATPAIAQEEEGAAITASASVDYVSHYVFRGYEQDESDIGAGIQPGIEFTLPVDDGIGLTVGTWGSIHTDTAEAGTTTPGKSNPNYWYEQDVYAGLGFDIGDLSISTGLTYYTYPSSAANIDITEYYISVGFDDSELLGDFAFNPYALLAIELQKNAAADEAIYMELGGEFAVPMGDAPFSLSIPVAVGLSIEDYYNDATGGGNFWGFVSVGAIASVPMSDLIGTDEYFGAWDLSGGVVMYFMNSDVGGISPNTANEGDNYQLVVTAGLSRDW